MDYFKEFKEVEQEKVRVADLGFVGGYRPGQERTLAKALTVPALTSHRDMGREVKRQVDELRDETIKGYIASLGLEVSIREAFLLNRGDMCFTDLLHNHGYKVDVVKNGDGTESIRIYQLVKEIRLSAEVTVKAEEV